jgi:hypothetical protein
MVTVNDDVSSKYSKASSCFHTHAQRLPDLEVSRFNEKTEALVLLFPSSII